MGKTFLLKMIALQKVPPGLECKLFKEAGKYGRILSFNFKNFPGELSADSSRLFFPTLMVWFLSRIFNGCEVDGIHFEQCAFADVASFEGKQARINDWKRDCLKSPITDDMIEEYIRLTNIAFNVECSTPPVFLLDDIQMVCKRSKVHSRVDNRRSSFLSLLLTELAGKINPVCTCTGTNNGKLLNLTERSAIMPKVMSLTPLKRDFQRNWEEMTHHENLVSKSAVEFDPDCEVYKALVYATYKIPRLLFLAHQVWFRGMLENKEDQKVQLLTRFEKKASPYYLEMKEFWQEFSPTDLCHVMFATGCRWRVRDTDKMIPGTTIEWNALIQKSLIFPYGGDCYLFPFTLIWSETNVSMADRPRFSDFKKSVDAACNMLVPNLKIEHLFTKYGDICVLDIKELGKSFQKLLTASFAVKYYLCKLEVGNTDVPLNYVYEPSACDADMLSNRQTVDFSHGIHFLATGTTSAAPHAVSSSVSCSASHKDMILYSKEGLIAVKLSLVDPSASAIETQLTLKPANDLLLSISISYGQPGSVKVTSRGNVILLSGAGVCNGISLELLKDSKLLQSSD